MAEGRIVESEATDDECSDETEPVAEECTTEDGETVLAACVELVTVAEACVDAETEADERAELEAAVEVCEMTLEAEVE